VAPAHTDGDTVVYFRKANVLHTGDLFSAGRYPVWVLDSGGTINGMIDALERLAALVNDSTKIIPGHGVGPTDLKSLKQQHDFLVAVRDIVRKGIQEGKTAQQIIAAKPLAQFESLKLEGRTPEEFITLVYDDLSRK
jgi:glyoxylase-like metal-dependent hydrolase (beta-lactamase superfamily II)